jgi:hypothetical protein
LIVIGANAIAPMKFLRNRCLIFLKQRFFNGIRPISAMAFWIARMVTGSAAAGW